jgi:hypothetical protein
MQRTSKHRVSGANILFKAEKKRASTDEKTRNSGVKLTCASISKGYRVALHAHSEEYKKRHPAPFLVLSGKADFILPALVADHDGCITGL